MKRRLSWGMCAEWYAGGHSGDGIGVQKQWDRYKVKGVVAQNKSATAV